MDQPQLYRYREAGWRRGRRASGALVRWRLLIATSAVISLTLLAAACGGGAKVGVASLGTTTTAVPGVAGGASTSPDGDFAKLAACLRSHGVLHFPDDPASPAIRALKQSGAMSTPQFQAAAKACAKYAPTHASPPRLTTADQADYLKAANCMRSHGLVGFPDPVFSGGGVNFPIPDRMNTKSAQFLRARQICELLIPAGLPYSKSAEGGQ